MKKIICVMVMCLCLMGCGAAEQIYDNQNYESLTNEVGDITLYTFDGKVKEYKNAKVIYSNSNSLAMWIETVDGKKVYWQGFASIDLK